MIFGTLARVVVTTDRWGADRQWRLIGAGI